ncbi:DinB family protein [Ferruginibacter sp. HRS2-29]|uniref:DinB family protein n=1 Tax=Ferruginibacter sp. HRS2-29 TaxID=2487334 RepID=UPI0020CE339C|nr:DinB family protein [Ferruginibacter sp. HRS2-29]MCP9750910.1 DinB family protein [Ferruginibacter sp. HRS2-29]
MPKPLPATYAPHFDNYIKLVPEEDLIAAIKAQQPVIDRYFDTISEEGSMYAYAEGKWTLKEMLQHIIDAERIFCFRALAFARKEPHSVPGFEEDDYAQNSKANNRTWKSLCDELKAVRNASILLFESFTSEMLNSPGTGNGKPCTANAMGFVMVGHLNHHKNIIEERYMIN